MKKKIIALSVFSIGTLSFAGEMASDKEIYRRESIELVSHGIVHLMSNEPAIALEYFEKGRDCTERMDSSAHDFCLSFGEVVACDSLGLHEQCGRSIQTLFKIFNEIEDSIECGSAIDADEVWPVVSYFGSLAMLAPSPQIRAVLFSMLQSMTEEFRAPAQLASWTFDDQEDYSFELCKRHKKKKSKWDKFKSFLGDVGELFKAVGEIFKAADETKKSYEEFKRNHIHKFPRNLRMEDL